jgi:3-methyladenine DNA glycosylase AlkD
MPGQLKAIQKTLLQHANKAALQANEKFVPGSKKVYGVRNPVLNELAKSFKDGGFELVAELWLSGAYEEKMIALKMLGAIAKKDAAQALHLIEIFANDIDNWAICDTMGMQALKPIVTTHQKEIFAMAQRFNRSPDFWQRRLSLVLVEYYTRYEALLPEINILIQVLENDNEYYVKKAVVWLKRNMAKGK